MAIEKSNRVAIIGAGPAGLMAAQMLTGKGVGVDIYEHMPTAARKFLMAGKSGLNITHGEDFKQFLQRYRDDDPRLTAAIESFGPHKIIMWMKSLGIESFEGSTGRIFPDMMKASPLLRNWLALLSDKGALLHTRHRFEGWDAEGALCFVTAEGDGHKVMPCATVLALGGGSWARLGSDGTWQDMLAAKNVALTPFQASNCGFDVDWSDLMKDKFAGVPVKDITLSVGDTKTRGEMVVTKTGIEGGGVYMVSAPLRDELIAQREGTLLIDLKPSLTRAELIKRLSHPRGKQSMANHLRKSIALSGVKAALLRECTDKDTYQSTDRLANAIKALPLKVTSTSALDDAISTAGGVTWDALDEDYMLRDMPGVFCAGEMIAWDAPTGGYLLTACLATGLAAGKGVAVYMQEA